MDPDEEEQDHRPNMFPQNVIFQIGYHPKSKRYSQRQSSAGSATNGDLFVLSNVAKTPDVVAGTIFPSERAPYGSHRMFDPAKVVSQDTGDLIDPGSTTALLDSPNLDRSPNRKSGTKQLHRECCAPLFVHWNWPVIRMGCLCLCISSLVGILCVIVGVLLSRPPSCDPQRSWWQGSVMYEVFTASFVDSDHDGFGDFKGLASRLDYVKRLKVSTLRLSSVFSALDYPLEYEHIIDFDNVDPHLGHMSDFDDLVQAVHREGLTLVLDINPSVTSDQHAWAAHWLLDRNGEYAGYYVLANESTTANLVSDEDWDDDRKDPHRPFGSQLFLNWSHPDVRRDIFQSVHVWLRKGVDGFYLKHPERLRVRDDHELYEVLLSWRRLLDSYEESDNRGRIMMTSVDLADDLYERSSPMLGPILELFDLLDVHIDVEGGPANVSEAFSVRVRDSQKWRNVSAGPWFSWNLGDAESSRLGSRLDVDPLTALFALWSLPGSVSIFYGDEIGQKDAFDVISGRPFRTGQLGLMQWTDGPHANFTTSTPWIPVHPDYSTRNIDNASETLNVLARLTDIRNDAVALFMDGVFKHRRKTSNSRVVRQDREVLALERFYPRRSRYGAIINFASRPVTRDLSDLWFEGNVVAGTSHSLPTRVNFRELYLEPGEALLVEIIS
ncbi:alpha-glucosidase-like [Ornithodoros turicata]|uniref:alpha-glucosidase-like n=1 Tax=Ornithodoros turicata TaxID=34597 RepID=UPI00313890BD